MNCQPGDMAWVVRMPKTGDVRGDEMGKQLLGRPVKVLELVRPTNQSDIECSYELVWRLEEPIEVFDRFTHEKYLVIGLPDDCLKPFPPFADEDADEKVKEIEHVE